MLSPEEISSAHHTENFQFQLRENMNWSPKIPGKTETFDVLVNNQQHKNEISLIWLILNYSYLKMLKKEIPQHILINNYVLVK